MSRLTWYRVSWVLYIVGMVLIVGSWVGLVSAGVGWFGWLVAMAGCIMSWVRRRPRSACQVPPRPYSKADEIAKLDLLRKEGVLTDYEFEREKARILRQP